MSILIAAILGIIFVFAVGIFLFIEVRFLNDKYSKRDADRYAEDIVSPKIFGFAVLDGDYNKHFPDDAWVQIVEGTDPDVGVDVVLLSLDERSWRPRRADVAIGEKYVYALRHDGKHIMYRSKRSKHHDKIFGPIVRS